MAEWSDESVDWYAQKHGDHPSVFAVVDAIPFGGAEDVLDIGCGTGSALRAMAARTSGALVGVDPFERMLGHARALTDDGRVTFQVAGAESLPFEDDSFDVVTAINSTSHWGDLAKGLAEVARVLRPGGLFVLGGEDFTEPELLGGVPYREALASRGYRVTRQDLPDGCFVTLAVQSAK